MFYSVFNGTLEEKGYFYGRESSFRTGWGAELISSLRKEDILDFFGSSEFEDPSEATGWEGGCFLCALHEHDISILGEGTIYG
ncbi:MAG: hypothetical protein ACLTPG_09335 [Mediterraneibacter gnavus]